jgi:hypothetical protein
MGLVQYRTHVIRGPIETRKVLLIRSKLQHLRSRVPVQKRDAWYYEEYDELLHALRQERQRFWESKRDPIEIWCDIEPWADECRSYDL